MGLNGLDLKLRLYRNQSIHDNAHVSDAAHILWRLSRVNQSPTVRGP
ncbi:hypothetical protein RIEGSTA812A_PEG_1074 [invertebrate metagenome]|uniref:Uncharacterized protein n=1 Tax=invertebrate metagenome TaxID=1711999 RepID=A0A484H7S3_9ZZZZ